MEIIRLFDFDNFLVNFKDFYALRKKHWVNFDDFDKLVSKLSLSTGLGIRVYGRVENVIEWQLFFETDKYCYVLPMAFLDDIKNKFLRTCTGDIVDIIEHSIIFLTYLMRSNILSYVNQDQPNTKILHYSRN